MSGLLHVPGLGKCSRVSKGGGGMTKMVVYMCWVVHLHTAEWLSVFVALHLWPTTSATVCVAATGSVVTIVKLN